MEKGFCHLKISSIINFVLAALFYSISLKYSLVLVVFGFINLYFTNLDMNQLNKSKGWLILIGILLIFMNFISGIFTLIGYDCIQDYLKENKDKLSKEEVIDKDIKKIDLLLKLGVGMVVISAILFATSTWSAISNLVKLILLLCLGTLFIGLSIFSEKKLKIKKTTYTYWLLGCSFYLCTWIDICYFEYFGSLFSYKETLSDLAFLTTYLIATILTFITSKKFSFNSLLYFVYIGVYFIIYHFLKYIGINFMMIMLIITIMNIICSLCIKKESNNYLLKVSRLTNYIIFILILDNYHSYSPSLTFITAISNIINLAIISIKTNDFIDNLLIPIMIYIYLYIGVSNLENIKYLNLLVAFIFSCISIFIRYTKSNQKVYFIMNQVIYNIGMLCFYFNSIDNEIELLLVNIVYLITNLINSIDKEKNNKKNIDYILQPLPITLLILSVCEMIDVHFIKISAMMAISLISVMYGLMYTISKNKHKKIYNILFLLSVIFNMWINFIESEWIPSIILLICSIYLFIRNYFSKENKKPIAVLSYIVLLFNIYHASILINVDMILNYKEIISTCIVVLIYIILLLILRKKKIYEIITSVALVVLMYHLIENYAYNYNLSLVFENIVQFYILYLLVKHICETPSSKNLLTLLGIVFIIIQVIFIEGIYTGIYVGIVGIIVIILGYIDKENKALFNLGVIITIINIIYQLQNLWGKTPFWLYLLLVGLGLIGFVTYKEVKKIDNK